MDSTEPIDLARNYSVATRFLNCGTPEASLLYTKPLRGLESHGGGVAVFDYDRDGKLDLFFTGGGTISPTTPVTVRGLPGRLYRNLGGWKFADVTAAAGLADAPFYSHGAFAADYDHDGFTDLFVTGFPLIEFNDAPPRANICGSVSPPNTTDAARPSAVAIQY